MLLIFTYLIIFFFYFSVPIQTFRCDPEFYYQSEILYSGPNFWKILYFGYFVYSAIRYLNFIWMYKICNYQIALRVDDYPIVECDLFGLPQSYLQRALRSSKWKRVSEVSDLMLQQRLQSFLDLCELLLLLHRDAAHSIGPARQRGSTVNHFDRGAYSSKGTSGS